MFFSFSFVFVIFFIVFVAIFIFAGVTTATTISRRARDERDNDRSPIETALAAVTEKRTRTSHNDVGRVRHYHKYYYVTFQLENDEVREYIVTKPEYDALTEGVCGELSYQGTRFIGFKMM